MNKVPVAPNNFPFMSDPGHIYNLLTEEGFTTVNLGWSTFTFELVSNLTDDDGQALYGLTLFDDLLIKLDISLKDFRAREIIFHEIFHCILEGMGMDEENYKGDFIAIPNEALVCGVSKQILLLNNLNPGLLSLVMGQVPEPTKKKIKK